MGLIQDVTQEANTGNLGNAVKAFFRNSSPQPGTVDVTSNMNPNLKSGVDQQSNMGNMSQEDIANRSMQGVEGRGNPALATPQNLSQQSLGLGGNQDAGMQQALANRTNKLFSSHVNNLAQIAKMNAPLIQAQQQQQALDAQAHQEQMTNYMINAQAVKAQNAQAQKNAVLNSVLGLAGGVAGAALGGPGGAAMGSQMGGAAGTLLNGPQMPMQGLDTSGQGAMNYFSGGR